MRFSRYYNHESGNSNIYSRENLLGMTLKEMLEKELALAYQYNTIGIPLDEELLNSPYAHQYMDENGLPRWQAGVDIPQVMDEAQNQERLSFAPNDNISPEYEESFAPQKESFKMPDRKEMIKKYILQNSEYDLSAFQPLVDKGKAKLKEKINEWKQKPVSSPIKDAIENPKAQDSVMSELEKTINPDDSKETFENDQVWDDLKYWAENPVTEAEKSEYETEQKSLISKVMDKAFGNDKGTITGAATPVLEGKVEKVVDSKMKPGDYVQKWLYTNPITKSILPMSSKGITNAMDNFKDAKKDKNINIHEGLDSIKDAKLKTNLEKIDNYDQKSILEYDKDSYESRLFSNSPEIKHFIKNNKEAIRKGTLGSTVIEFGPNANNSKIKKYANYLNPRSLDRAYFLQHGTLFDHNLDDEGTYSAKLGDVYDFKKRPDTVKNIPNNWGYAQQENGNIDNYSILLNINNKPKVGLRKRKKSK